MNVLVIGATSAIAYRTSRIFAVHGHSLFLIGRDPEKLEMLAQDLRTHGAAYVDFIPMNLLEYEKHESAIKDAKNRLGGLDGVLIAHGTLSDQKACEKSFAITQRELETNYMSTVSLLTHLANEFEKDKAGFIAVISSVAGDRGRQSNYVYGSAKGGLSIFLQGLRNRLHRFGVDVITIKPGFVDTPMTVGFQKGWLWVSPEKVAIRIYRAIENRKKVVYIPGYWFWIMLIIRMIPEKIFIKLRL